MKTPTIKTYEEIFEEVLKTEFDPYNPDQDMFNKIVAKAYASQFVREAAERATIVWDDNEVGNVVDKDSILSLLKVIENE